MAVEIEERVEQKPDTSAADFRTYRVFDERLLVLCEPPAMARHIHCYLKALEVEPAEVDVRLAIFESGDGGGGNLLLCSPEAGMAQFKKAGRQAWLAFRQFFMRLILAHTFREYALHAAAVSDGHGRTALIFGVPNAGKTSTLIGLLRRGYHMLTDDYCVVRPDTGCAVSLPTGVTVTEATLDHYPDLRDLAQRACAFWCEGKVQWTVHPGDRYALFPAYAESRPTHLYFLYPDFGAPSRLEPCRGEEAWYWLQDGRFHPGRVQRHDELDGEARQAHFELAKRMLRECRAYRVANGDLPQTVELIAASLERD